MDTLSHTRSAYAPTWWTWALPDAGPPMEDAFQIGVSLRQTLMTLSRREGASKLPDSFHRSMDHSHARYLSLDMDEDGRVDQVMVIASGGLPASVTRMLGRMAAFQHRGQTYGLETTGVGQGSPFQHARIWTNMTPWVTPWGRLSKTGKERAEWTPQRQFEKELEALSLAPVEVAWDDAQWIGERRVPAARFSLGGTARGDMRPKPDAVAAFATLVFPEPVADPLSMGYGAHFGLGLFMPAG